MGTIPRTKLTSAFKWNTWKADLPLLFKEIAECSGIADYAGILMVTNSIIAEMAERAAEIGDPVLDAYMIRLHLYDVPIEERYATIEKLAKYYAENVEPEKITE